MSDKSNKIDICKILEKNSSLNPLEKLHSFPLMNQLQKFRDKSGITALEEKLKPFDLRLETTALEKLSTSSPIGLSSMLGVGNSLLETTALGKLSTSSPIGLSSMLGVGNSLLETTALGKLSTSSPIGLSSMLGVGNSLLETTALEKLSTSNPISLSSMLGVGNSLLETTALGKLSTSSSIGLSSMLGVENSLLGAISLSIHDSVSNVKMSNMLDTLKPNNLSLILGANNLLLDAADFLKASDFEGLKVTVDKVLKENPNLDVVGIEEEIDSITTEEGLQEMEKLVDEINQFTSKGLFIYNPEYYKKEILKLCFLFIKRVVNANIDSCLNIQTILLLTFLWNLYSTPQDLDFLKTPIAPKKLMLNTFTNSNLEYDVRRDFRYNSPSSLSLDIFTDSNLKYDIRRDFRYHSSAGLNLGMFTDSNLECDNKRDFRCTLPSEVELENWKKPMLIKTKL